jgi:hypothetical protein
MARHWFTPWGWIYRQVAWPGVGVFPYVVPTLMLLNWVASKASSERSA